MQALEIAGAVALVLLVVVLIHEGGHFVVAKLSGIRVDEFAVGFGPRLASKTIGETRYSLRLIPAGGFVRMAGMLGLPGEADAGERNFYRASIPKRLATILAGVAANLLLAGSIFTVTGMLPTGSSVQPGGAAQLAGMRSGDVILSVDGHPIRHDNLADVTADLHAATTATQGRPASVVIGRDGAQRTLTVRPSLVLVNGGAATQPSPGPPTSVDQLSGSALFVVTAIGGAPVGEGDPAALIDQGGTVSGFLLNSAGVTTRLSNLTASGVSDGFGAQGQVQASWRLGVSPSVDGAPFVQALSSGFGQIPAFVSATYTGIANLITNPRSGGLNGPQGLSGPVGIVRETAVVTQQGALPLLEWIAFISMNLGLINLLPIPFLDGGKAALILLEAVRRRRLDPRHEALIYAVGLALVVVFAIYVTIGDVSRTQ